MERVWRQLEPPVRSIGRGLEEILLKDDRNPKEWKTAVHREGNRARRAVQPWNENVPECPRGKNHGRRSGEEELWKHRAVTMRGKVVRLPCRSRRPSADPPRGEIHSFFRLAAEITFRHSVEKKEEEGWSLHDFESFCQMEYWIVDRDYPYPRLYSLVYSRYIVFVFS